MRNSNKVMENKSKGEEFVKENKDRSLSVCRSDKDVEKFDSFCRLPNTGEFKAPAS